MADKYSRSVVRVVTAQLSQAVGFDSIQSSSLDILTDVFERYLQALGKTVHDFSEQRGQTIPNLGDVEFAFKQLHVPLHDIVDYTQQMEPVVFPHKVGMFPAPKVSNLQFPSGNNPEDFERGEHIPLYMPSMIQAPQTSTQEADNNSTQVEEGQQSKKANFVIAGKHSKGSSSDEDDYSAGELSNEEYMSDDSLAHNPTKSRHLTKPEDIPMIEGTAPSSLMTMPSSEMDELQGSMSPRRRTSFENIEAHHEKATKKPSKTSQLIRPFPIKWQSEKTPTGDPKWLSDKKKSQDVYDADWLHGGGGASPVHLSKPPTPDAAFSSPSLEKRPWTGKSHKETPKSISKKDSKHIQKHSTPSGSSGQKHVSKINVERKSSHSKSFKPSFKHTHSIKKENLSDEPIKARIEAAERLIHSPPVSVFKPNSPKSVNKHKPISQPFKKSPIRSSIEKAEKLLKHPPVEDLKFPSSRESSPALKLSKVTDKQSQDKLDRSSFASSKSMYDAIDAVVNRASDEMAKKDEEAKKEAEEAELMKFSHLVDDSSSSDSEVDVSDKVAQMLQLEERGLRDAHPPTPGSSPVLTPTPSSSPRSLGIDEDEDVVVDSDSGDSIKLPPKKSYDFGSDMPKPKIKVEKHSKKEKHKKKMKKMSSDIPENNSSHKSHSSTKSKKEKHSIKPASFVTTETISEKPVKMKVKLKHFDHSEPKLFDVESDRDRVRITETKHSSKSRDEKHKSKEGKHHKSKEHKKHTTTKLLETKHSSGELDMSVEKIILKKSKSGDAKVVKTKIKEYTRSPSPPSPIANRSNLPLPKLSVAVPVMSAISKEKKKSKKEKKKKKEREREFEKEWGEEKERHSEKVRKESKDKSHKDKYKDINWESKASSRRESFDSDVASPLVPKLLLKMGASEKKFVIKQPSSNQKSSGKKRSLSSAADSPIPAKDRKVSVESVKMVSEGFAAAVERKVITQTISAGPVGVYEDADGNKVWICPGCDKQDDGSPMIGCDTCDDWYHWPCVNITQEPPDNVDWYCPRCIKIQKQTKLKASGKKRKKK